ncbi:MAG: CoA pyrophosphatase [Actinomycetota bacterium]
MYDDLETRLAGALRARPGRRFSVAGARDAAVLLPVVLKPQPGLIFTVRTDTLPSHKGQISFPGGSIDASDVSAEAAALREANEELGLDPAQVRVLGELDSIETFVSGFVVTPIVGVLDGAPELKPNPMEVARVLHVPLTALTDAIRSDPGFEHAGRSYPTEAWVHGDDVIWGVTANLLRLFLERLAEAGPVEAPGESARRQESTSRRP